MINHKGFVVLLVPLTLAFIGLVGTGVIANMDHEKGLSIKRDAQRQADIVKVEEQLKSYFSTNKQYPIQKNESGDGWEVLTKQFENLPNDPLFNKGWRYAYWSDGKGYTLRYMSEANMVEQVIFGY